MPKIAHNTTKVERRKRRVGAQLFGTAKRPRVSVRRSNKFVFLQAVDDSAGQTVASAHDKQVKSAGKKAITKTETAKLSAQSLAQQLKQKKIGAVIFDRGQYKYHGRVQTVAQTLRDEGIKV